MPIGDRIREERTRLGLNQTDFAALAGTTKQTLYSWEQGKTAPDGFQLERLAKEGVNMAYVLDSLIKDNTPQKGKKKPPSGSDLVRPSGSALNGDNLVYIPRYDVSASAGSGHFVSDEFVKDYMAFQREWITKIMGLDVHRLAMINVAGDSMSPTLSDGDLILLDTRPVDSFREGIYVINLDGSLLVKRLRMRMSGNVDVISDNERYGIEHISGEQLSQLNLVGRVVWQGRRL